MNRKTASLVSLAVLLAVITAWFFAGEVLVGWIRAQLGIKPSIQIDFTVLSGEDNQKTTFARYPGTTPECRETVPELVQAECNLTVGKANGVPVTSVTFQFERDRLMSVRLLLPSREHKAFMTEMRSAHGMWSKLDQRDAHGAELVAWSLPGGRLVMSEDAMTAPESVVRWTSKTGLFRETVREIGQLIQNETNLTHVTAVVQVQAGARSYDTTSPFRRSFRHARAVPNEYNAPLAEWLVANAESVPSLLLLELAQRLVATDGKEAMRWYATFQILMDYDAARCADPTASRGSSGNAVLALYPSLRRYAEENPAIWREARTSALSWVRVRQIRSSPMWLCASGMRSVRINRNGEPQPVSVRELMLPESRWPAAWRDVLARESH